MHSIRIVGSNRTVTESQIWQTQGRLQLSRVLRKGLARGLLSEGVPEAVRGNGDDNDRQRGSVRIPAQHIPGERIVEQHTSDETGRTEGEDAEEVLRPTH